MDCGYHEKRRRLALWPAGGFLWGGQSRILLFITWNIKLPTLPRGTVRPPWILTTSTTAGDGHTIPLPSLSLFLSLHPSLSIFLSLNVRGSSADLIAPNLHRSLWPKPVEFNRSLSG